MKQITPETLYDFQFVSNPRFSPDGKHLAFIVQQADKENNAYKGDLYLLSDNGPLRLTAMGDAKSMAWTPDNTLLFPAVRSDKEKKMQESGEFFTSFYEISPAGGEARHAFTLPCRVLQLRHLCGTRYVCLVSYDAVQPALEAMEEPEGQRETPEPLPQNTEFYDASMGERPNSPSMGQPAEGKHRTLLTAAYGSHEIEVRRSYGLTELIVDGRVYGRQEGVVETGYTIRARVSGHDVETEFTPTGKQLLRVDGQVIARKQRLF